MRWAKEIENEVSEKQRRCGGLRKSEMGRAIGIEDQVV
jgi:hypothetical protein